MSIKPYAKAVVGTLAAIATWGVTAGADGEYSQVELWGLLGVIAAALGIYATTNTPPGPVEPDDPALYPVNQPYPGDGL